MKKEITNAGFQARLARVFTPGAKANKSKFADRPFDAVAYAAALEMLG